MLNYKTKNILVACTARDCGKQIKQDIESLQHSLKNFNQVHWLVVESDSQDDTLSKLDELKSYIANFSFMSLGILSADIPLRTERLALCRNTYLKELRDNSIYRDVDFVIIADLDGVNKLISEESIASCFVRDDWGVCTANQLGVYYDIWALRHEMWSPNDCWQQAKFFEDYGMNKKLARNCAVYSKQLKIHKNSHWIEVDSAFSGLAIYRRPVLKKAKYIGLTENGIEICEHVTLHQQIKQQGFNIFINPALINSNTLVNSAHVKPRFSSRKIFFSILVFSLGCLLYFGLPLLNKL